VAKRLIPQRVPWLTPGGVAQGTLVPAGVTPAWAIVHHQAGKAVALGWPYLLRRLGGGEVFGTLRRGGLDASKRP